MFTDILQPTHLLFVLIVALLVLGPKRLPEVGRSLGRGLRDFRSALSGEEHEEHHEVPAETPSMATPPAEPVTHAAEPVSPAAEPVTSGPAEPVSNAEPAADQVEHVEQPEHVA